MVQISKTLSPSKYNAVYHGLAIVLKGLFGNLTIMKKLTVLLFIILAFTACSKKDDPTLTGTWDMTETFTSSPHIYSGIFEITQTNNGTLTGFLQYDFMSYPDMLLPTSQINNNTVTIEVMFLSFKESFRGTVSSDFNSMNGIYYADGIKVGTWSATRK